MSAITERKRAKPVLLTETSAGTMTWDRSIQETSARLEKNRLHGHKLPYACGDEVEDFTGRRGILVHKEFMYEQREGGPNHDVWLLVVLYGAEQKTYSNPSALSLRCKRKDIK